MRSSRARKKAPQTLKTGLKQGVNRVKRQISLPNAKRLKNQCSSGRKLIRPESCSFCRKNKTTTRTQLKKMLTYAKKNQEHPKIQEYTAICGGGTHTVHKKIKAINKISRSPKNQPSKLQNKISLTIGRQFRRRAIAKRRQSIRPSQRRGQGHGKTNKRSVVN